MRGRGSTKDFAFFLTPSLHRPRAGASAACFATKMQNTSLDLHALGVFLRPKRARPRKQRCCDCRVPAGVGERGNSAIALQRILRSTYMMGQGWQLKAPNLDQYEPLRENVLPAWSAKDTGRWSPGGGMAYSSGCIHVLVQLFTQFTVVFVVCSYFSDSLHFTFYFSYSAIAKCTLKYFTENIRVISGAWLYPSINVYKQFSQHDVIKKMRIISVINYYTSTWN